MSESIRRQNASAHMPLAVCLDGLVIDLVPARRGDGQEAQYVTLEPGAIPDTPKGNTVILCGSHARQAGGRGEVQRVAR